MKRFNQTRAWIVAAIAGTTLLGPALRSVGAANPTWIDPVDPTGIGNDGNAAADLNGTYETGTHWSPSGIPAATANVVFNAPGYHTTPYTVSFTNDEAANSAAIFNPVTFNLGGNSFTLDALSSTLNGASLLVANNASLTILNGGVSPMSVQVGSSTATQANPTFLSVDGSAGNAFLLVHSQSTINNYQTIEVVNGGTMDTGDNTLINQAPDLAGGGLNTGQITVDSSSYFNIGNGAEFLGGSVLIQDPTRVSFATGSLTLDSVYFNDALTQNDGTSLINITSTLLDPHNANAVIPTTLTGGVDVDVQAMNIIGAELLLTSDSGNTWSDFTIVGNTVLNVATASITSHLFNLDGDGAPGTGATINVNFSLITVHSDLWVGELGNASASFGDGTVVNIDGGLVVGDQEFSSGTLTLDGTASQMITALAPANSYYGFGDLIVGGSGTGQMTISGGAKVTVGGGFDANIGWRDNGDGTGGTGTLTVTGAGIGQGGSLIPSTLDLFTGGGDMQVGVYANSVGELDIDSGAFVTNVNGVIGLEPGATGIANVTGSANSTGSDETVFSEWQNNGSLTVGDAGAGTLTVTFGAGVDIAEGLTIGAFLGSTGQVTISQGAFLGVAEDPFGSGLLFVGNAGTGSLDILGGSYAVASSNVFVGHSTTGAGEITVDGGSGLAVSGTLWVGYAGQGSLTMGDESQAQASAGYFAYAGGSTGIGLIDDSELDFTGGLSVGESGAGSLTITDGGTVTTGDTVFVGNQTGSAGTVIIQGTNSVLIDSGDFEVGESGKGALTIQQGGSLTASGSSRIAAGPGSSGIALVTDPGSIWAATNGLQVGTGGNGTLTIQNAGSVTAGGSVALFVGFNPGSAGQVLVTGSGSRFAGTSQIGVGYQGDGTLTISAGGIVTASSGNSSTYSALAIGLETSGAGMVTITDPGSKLLLAGEAAVGFGNNGSSTTNGGLGVLNVVNGGFMSDTNGYIGRYGGSTGVATVSGIGSFWQNTGALFIAANDTQSNISNMTLAAGSGSLTIGAGATVSAATAATIGAAGLLSMQGGNFSAPSTALAGMISGYGNIFGPVSGMGSIAAVGPAALVTDGLRVKSLTVTNALVLRNDNSALGTTKVSSLLIASNTAGTYSGSVDITTDKLIVESTGATGNKAALVLQIQAMVLQGKNGTSWTGKGITSSTVAADVAAGTNHTYHTVVAVVDNGAYPPNTGYTMYGGQPVDASSIIVTRALAGDANLDGTVNNTDLVALLTHYNLTGQTQATGDYNGDGTVNNTDLVALLTDYNQTLPGGYSLAPAGDPAATAPAIGGIAPAPEPASLAAMWATFLLLIRRRRRAGS